MSSMWADLVFRVRSALPDLGTLLGSWRLSIGLMAVAALYQALLAVWARSASTEVVRSLASLLPFWTLYALLLLNLVCCLRARWPILRRDLAMVGSWLFHGALVAVAAGFLATLALREEARVWAAVGETYTGDPDQRLRRAGARAPGSAAPDVRFTVTDIAPELWRDRLLFTALEAALELPSGERVATRVNRPVWLGWCTSIRLAGLGLAPRYEVADGSGRVVESAFVKMDVFPPGRRDSLRLQTLPHRVYAEVFPDLVERDGAPATRGYALGRPGVRVGVWRGKLLLAEAVLAQDEAVDFEGLSLRFPEIRYWGEFAIVRDPGAPVVLLGYALGVAGLALALCGGRQEPDGGEAAT